MGLDLDELMIGDNRPQSGFMAALDKHTIRVRDSSKAHTRCADPYVFFIGSWVDRDGVRFLTRWTVFLELVSERWVPAKG